MASQVRRRGMFVAAIAALSVVAVPGSAAAAGKLKVKVLDNNLGKVWDSQKAKVKVDPKKAGTARVSLVVTRPGGGEAVAKAKKKVGRKGKTLTAKIRNSGRDALTDCSNDGLQARVSFKFKGGGKAKKVVNSAAEQTFALCSQGSEDPEARPYYGPAIPTANADRCDPLDPSLCMYPFPSDHLTVASEETETGRRINFQAASMPQNNSSVGIDPTDYNRADGFSPGEPIVVRLPGLDNESALEETDGVPLSDLASYADADQPIVVIDTETGERHPIWSEMDSDAEADADRVLYIRPAVNFIEGHRYIVALRDLRDAEGDPIDPGLAFRAYRDGLTTKDDAIEGRRDHMEGLFTTLQDAGIQRADLNLAWDFTVASSDSLASRVLAMREDAFDQLGDEDLSDLTVDGASPDFTVTNVTNYEPCSAGSDPEACEPGEDDQKLRQVQGNLDVPCYLNQNNCPVGAQFAFSGPDDTTPDFNPAFRMTAPYTCIIPRAVTNGSDVVPARASLYGHGLFGSRTEVESGTGGNIKAMADEHNFVFCAVDWVGFSNADQISGLLIAGNVSNFPRIGDRTQQGFINFMYLGRAMIHADGFTSDQAFQLDPDGDGGEDPEAVIDTSNLYYDGNSQGGILGGALTALAPDHTRAALGVPAMNYSTLIQRATPFQLFKDILDPAYPNELERPLIYSLMQMLWDRGEPSGYAQHMTTDPLPDTPEHQVLLHVAYGDYQVSNYEAEVEARTIGAGAYMPALDPGRHWDVNPLWGIEPIADPESYTGSAIVYWDGGPADFTGTIGLGTGAPPLGNLPAQPGPIFGADPHSYPRRDVQAQAQKAQFLAPSGTLMPCADDGPCYANGYTGTP